MNINEFNEQLDAYLEMNIDELIDALRLQKEMALKYPGPASKEGFFITGYVLATDHALQLAQSIKQK